MGERGREQRRFVVVWRQTKDEGGTERGYWTSDECGLHSYHHISRQRNKQSQAQPSRQKHVAHLSASKNILILLSSKLQIHIVHQKAAPGYNKASSLLASKSYRTSREPKNRHRSSYPRMPKHFLIRLASPCYVFRSQSAVAAKGERKVIYASKSLGMPMSQNPNRNAGRMLPPVGKRNASEGPWPAERVRPG